MRFYLCVSVRKRTVPCHRTEVRVEGIEGLTILLGRFSEVEDFVVSVNPRREVVVEQLFCFCSHLVIQKCFPLRFDRSVL